jgi:hypothetical protein
MCRGSRAYVISLDIENQVALTINIIGVFFVSPCPICGLFFSYNNIVLTLCGCIYHMFCIYVYLASKTTKVCNIRVLANFHMIVAHQLGF